MSPNKKLTKSMINVAINTYNLNGPNSSKTFRTIFGNRIGNLVGQQLGVATQAMAAAATGGMSQTQAAQYIIKAENKIKNIVARGVTANNYLAAVNAGTRNYTRNRTNFFGRLPEAATRPAYRAWWAAVNAKKSRPIQNPTQSNINAALSEINAAGNNMNKLRGIQTRLTNAGFNPTQASENAKMKYMRLANRLAVNQAIKNANALAPGSNNAAVNRVLGQLRNALTRANNATRPRISGKIEALERRALGVSK